MSNDLDITAILENTTFVFSILRTMPAALNIECFLHDIQCFYSKNPSAWEFNEYMSIFAENCPYGTYQEFLESALMKRKKLRPTDNKKLIADMRPVFAQLFDHASQLNSNNKTEQLKDFLDSIHCLSEALIVKKKWHSRDFWNVYIKPYCKRWNVQFPGMRKYFFRFFFFNRRSF